MHDRDPGTDRPFLLLLLLLLTPVFLRRFITLSSLGDWKPPENVKYIRDVNYVKWLQTAFLFYFTVFSLSFRHITTPFISIEKSTTHSNLPHSRALRHFPPCNFSIFG